LKKITIGTKEYNIGELSAFEIDEINEKLEDKKLSKMRQSFSLYLCAIKKYNPDVKMTLEEFMKAFPLSEMKKKIKQLNEYTGVNFIKAEAGKK